MEIFKAVLNVLMCGFWAYVGLNRFKDGDYFMFGIDAAFFVYNLSGLLKLTL